MGKIHISTARELLADVARIKPSAVFSIEDPDVLPGDPMRAPRLYEDHGDKTRQYIQSFLDVDKPQQGAPTFEQLKAALYFMAHHAHARRENSIIVQCPEGARRSMGMALAFLIATSHSLTYSEIFLQLKALRDKPEPNLLLTQMIDSNYLLDGSLLRAVKGDSLFLTNHMLREAAQNLAKPAPIVVTRRRVPRPSRP